jgi:transposase-like protein
MIYWNKEVAENLAIGDSTLRRWCILLEQKGYIFTKDQHNNRAFNDQDLIILRRLKETSKMKGMNLESAVNAVLSMVDNANKTTLVHVENRNSNENDIVQSAPEELLKKLLEKIENQEVFNQELLKRLDQQQQYLEETLKRRDNQLMNVVREIQETKKLTAAASEEKKPWWKLW